MKIIDLLNKIANDEKLPKIIIYDKRIYEYQEGSYDWEYYNNGTIKFLLTELFESVDNTFSILNYEVEILEEEKKIPEKLNKNYNITQYDINQPSKVSYDMEQLVEMVQDIYEKQGEICDYLKSKVIS